MSIRRFVHGGLAVGLLLLAGGAAAQQRSSSQAPLGVLQTGTLNAILGLGVGVNTEIPAAPLHVFGFGGSTLQVERADGTTPNIRFRTSGGGPTQSWLFQNNATSGVFAIRDETGVASPFRINPGANENTLNLDADSQVAINRSSATNPLHVGTDGTNGNGAFLSAGGVWTNASSREFKDEIVELTAEEAMAALEDLEAVKFRYKGGEERHVGFIAEEVPELVASPDRQYLSSMDIVAVLARAVQEQQRELTALQQRLRELEGKAGAPAAGE